MRGLLVSLLAVAFGVGALAGVPTPPDQITHAGVLMDATGAPLSGPVDLTARLYDASAAGVLVFKQSFTGVALSDGHYSLNLGPTGEETDTPSDPLTTSLRSALTGDLAAGPGRFVEITVSSDPPLARVQLVLVPYALRAGHASTSDVSTQSLDTQSVAGLDSSVLNTLYQNFNEDGGPVAGDPREGTADTDGDGLLNFVDPDNDNDGLLDTTELNLGSDINLVSPTISQITPVQGPGESTTAVTITGANFLPGVTVKFGDQTSVLSNVTLTSLAASAGPRPPCILGNESVDVVVTNPNGENARRPGAFTFQNLAGPGPVPVPFTIWSIAAPISIDAQGTCGVLAYGSQQTVGLNRYAMDTVSDSNTAFDVDATFNGRTPSALGWNANLVLHGLRANATTNQIEVLRDSNADNILQDAEAVVLELGGTPRTFSPSLTFDASGRPAGGYIRVSAGPVVARAFHDRDGDGAFGGVNESVTIETAGVVNALGDAHFDLGGRLAYVFYNSTLGAIRVAWDRSGDGDFADSQNGVPELGSAAVIGVPFCLAADFDSAGRLAIVYALNGNPSLLYDLNGDLDFADPGESIALPGSGASYGCDIVRSQASGRLVIAFTRGAELRMAVDTNGDADFSDAADFTLLGSSATAPVSVATNASGAVRALTREGVWLGPGALAPATASTAPRSPASRSRA